jgi:hypothetical protein
LSFSKKIQFTKNYFPLELDYKKNGAHDAAFFYLKHIDLFSQAAG